MTRTVSTASARRVHWIAAGAVGLAVATGFGAAAAEGGAGLAAHVAAGSAAGAAALVRVARRGLTGPPPASRRSPAPRAARATHRVLRALPILVALAGEATLASAGGPAAFADPDFAAGLHALHAGAARLLLALIALHVAAALAHPGLARLSGATTHGRTI